MRTRISSAGRHAFTLVEMLVVAAIIVTATGLIVLQFSRSLGANRLRAEAGRLAATASFARQIAVAQRRRVKMEFNLDENAYALMIEPKPISEPGVFSPLEHAEGRRHDLAEGVRFITVQNETDDSDDTDDSDNGAILSTTFWRDGSAQKTVVYMGADDDVYTIVVRGSTGLVKVFDFEQEVEQIELMEMEI